MFGQVGISAANTIELLTELNYLFSKNRAALELDNKRLTYNSARHIHSLVTSPLLRLPLQILIKLVKPRPSLRPHAKPRKRPRQHAAELLSVSESRAARRDGTGLEAEEMVAAEEQRHASAPFELRWCVFLGWLR